jgi:hypothetical protein
LTNKAYQMLVAWAEPHAKVRKNRRYFMIIS